MRKSAGGAEQGELFAVVSVRDGMSARQRKWWEQLRAFGFDSGDEATAKAIFCDVVQSALDLAWMNLALDQRTETTGDLCLWLWQYRAALEKAVSS
jgi:hypothetical protein